MILWWITWIVLGWTLLQSRRGMSTVWDRMHRGAREIQKLASAQAQLKTLQEMIESGLAPDSSQWDRIREGREDLCGWMVEVFEQLRQRGASVLPTLKRFQEFLREQEKRIREGRSKTSQAQAQVLIAGVLVPVVATGLAWLLPSVGKELGIWGLASMLAFALACLGAVWINRLADHARWGGVSKARRPWILMALGAGERVLALIRSGSPPDMAWTQMIGSLNGQGVAGLELTRAWGFSFWRSEGVPQDGFSGIQRDGSSLEQSVRTMGLEIRQAMQVSVMEGRPCLDRVESILLSFASEVWAAQEREVQMVSTRALLPLFLCVAPGLLGLLGLGLFLTWREVL